MSPCYPTQILHPWAIEGGEMGLSAQVGRTLDIAPNTLP